MATFERRTLRINGIDTVLLEAGSGPTLVYFHGAGTVTGFDFANHWAKKFRVLIPYHPGFGASADAAEHHACDDLLRVRAQIDHAVVARHVIELVPEHGGELRRVREPRQHAGVDVDVAVRQRKCVR